MMPAQRRNLTPAKMKEVQRPSIKTGPSTRLARTIFRSSECIPMAQAVGKTSRVEETAAVILRVMLERGLTLDSGEAGQL